MVTWGGNNVHQEEQNTSNDIFTSDDTGEIIINDDVVSI